MFTGRPTLEWQPAERQWKQCAANKMLMSRWCHCLCAMVVEGGAHITHPGVVPVWSAALGCYIALPTPEWCMCRRHAVYSLETYQRLYTLPLDGIADVQVRPPLIDCTSLSVYAHALHVRAVGRQCCKLSPSQAQSAIHKVEDSLAGATIQSA